MSYRYLDEITYADAAFEAQGRTPEELFRSSGDAVLGLMIRDPQALEPMIGRSETFNVSAAAVPETERMGQLLHAALERILYFKDAEGLLLRIARAEFSADGVSMAIQYSGEPLERFIGSHPEDMGVDAKAITHHRFSVKQQGNSWVAMVVVDV